MLLVSTADNMCTVHQSGDRLQAALQMGSTSSAGLQSFEGREGEYTVYGQSPPDSPAKADVTGERISNPTKALQQDLRVAHIPRPGNHNTLIQNGNIGQSSCGLSDANLDTGKTGASVYTTDSGDDSHFSSNYRVYQPFADSIPPSASTSSLYDETANDSTQHHTSEGGVSRPSRSNMDKCAMDDIQTTELANLKEHNSRPGSSKSEDRRFKNADAIDNSDNGDYSASEDGKTTHSSMSGNEERSIGTFHSFVNSPSNNSQATSASTRSASALSSTKHKLQTNNEDYHQYVFEEARPKNRSAFSTHHPPRHTTVPYLNAKLTLREAIMDIIEQPPPLSEATRADPQEASAESKLNGSHRSSSKSKIRGAFGKAIDMFMPKKDKISDKKANEKTDTYRGHDRGDPIDAPLDFELIPLTKLLEQTQKDLDTAIAVHKDVNAKTQCCGGILPPIDFERMQKRLNNFKE